eukprot:6525523-Alexandrium_andersonii.AAC.1
MMPRAQKAGAASAVKLGKLGSEGRLSFSSLEAFKGPFQKRLPGCIVGCPAEASRRYLLGGRSDCFRGATQQRSNPNWTTRGKGAEPVEL